MDNLKGIPGWKFAPFDVTASIWGEPDQLRALLSDPEWHSKVIAFEKGWIDTERAETQIGWETDFLKDGKIVNVKELKDYNWLETLERHDRYAILGVFEYLK